MPNVSTVPSANGNAGRNASASAAALARRLGLRYVARETLSIRRRRQGKGWSFLAPNGRAIRDPAVVRRLSRLAVPPAYAEVLYSDDPAAHLQAVGRDAAGRLQYRYHPDWEKVREQRKARRLARLAEVLPRIRRSVGQHLAGNAPTRELALAAVIELIACSAIRSGRESYARERGTRGAATLLKSNVAVDGDNIALRFRGKGGKTVQKEFACPRFARVVDCLRALPGRRLFQYRMESGEVRPVRAREVNVFLREIAGAAISLKDFRTLIASASVLEMLARRRRPRASGSAANRCCRRCAPPPTTCTTRRRSAGAAMCGAVVAAFEDGVLERFSDALAHCRSPVRRAKVLARVIKAAA